MKLSTLSMGLALIVAANSARAGAVVVARDSPIDAVTSEQVRRIFLGSDTMMSGVPLVVIFQRDEAVRTDFEKKVLEKTGAALEAYWVKQIFTGKAAPPKEVGSDAEVRAMIARTPGAIGYLSDAGLDNTVKVILRY